MKDPTLMRSDWWPWLQRQAWFRTDAPLADNYPKAVEALLRPQANRKAFFQEILRPGVPPSRGYVAMARLLARKVVRTVLTTNFDQLLADTAKSLPEVHAITEIKTPDDFGLFSTNPQYPQILHIHGSVDHYTDQNVEHETERLNSELVELLKHLLRDHPLVVVGYRGTEPSVMRHLLLGQKDGCLRYRQGIYWCHLVDTSPADGSPLLRALAAEIDGNLQFVEIDGFDELMGLLDRSLPELVRPPTAPSHDTTSALSALANDLNPAPASPEDLNDVLLRTKLIAYSEAVRLPRPDLATAAGLRAATAERGLAIVNDGSWTPTNGALILFARTADLQLKQARLEVRMRGPAKWVFALLERPEPVDSGAGEVEDSVIVLGDLWTQLERMSDLLARANKPFRLKGPTSQDVYPYPPLALRELLTNLLAHRDYTRFVPGVVTITPGEIRFENPGGLVDHVRHQLEDRDLQVAVTSSARGIKGYRNPVIADFFFSAGAMDKEGSGLPDVVTESTNNLNDVRFGPTPDNDAFVAIIACRPEALTVDAETRTARPLQGELRYSPNLLAITKWPSFVWKLGTLAEPKEFTDTETAGVPPFAVYRHWIWTFADPSQPAMAPLRELALTEETHRVPVDEMFAEAGLAAALPRLLSMALTNKLGSLGLRTRPEAGRIRAYFPSLEGQPRQIEYRSLFKQANRTVAKPITRSTGITVYWEHKGVSLRFERFGATWSLALVPCYIFTMDGDLHPVAPDRVGPLSTRRASRDYNPTVLHDLVFWSRVLSRGVEPAFEIDITSPPRPTIDPGSAPSTIELSSMIPTVVFQENIDANMSAAAEVEMTEEERLALESSIENLIEESRLEEIADDAEPPGL